MLPDGIDIPFRLEADVLTALLLNPDNKLNVTLLLTGDAAVGIYFNGAL